MEFDCSCFAECVFALLTMILGMQRFPVPVFFDSDPGSETVQSRNLVLIPIPRLSMARTRFRVRFRDCTGFELDSDSGFETAQA